MSEPCTTAGPAAGPSVKKLPCWVCGGDLLFNFATVNASRVTVHTYCPRCTRRRVLSLMLD